MSSAFDRYRNDYESVVEQSISFSGLRHEFFLRAKARLLAKIFSRTFGAERPSLLDVGCGVGVLHPFLAPIAGRMAGADVSSEALARARLEHGDVDYRMMDGGHLPWADCSFDVSLAVCVLHHVPPSERAALLAEMRRTVRPGGLIVVIEHNPLNPATRLAVLRCPFDHDAVLLGARSARRLLATAGLEQIESAYFLTIPAEGRWAEALDGRFGRIPLGAQYAAFGRRPRGASDT